MIEPRSNTPVRTDTRSSTKRTISTPQPPKPVSRPSASRSRVTSERYTTITMKQYNLIRGKLRSLIQSTPENRKNELQFILNRIDPLEPTQTHNFEESTLITRIISLSEINNLLNYLNTKHRNQIEAEQNIRTELLRLLEPFQTHGGKKRQIKTKK